MTGYESKKKAAQAKTIDEVNWVDHEPDGRRAAQEPVAWMHVQGNYEEPSWRQLADDEVERGWQQYPLYTTPPQRPLVEPTGNEWFEWWRVSKVADATEAEIDFADFLIIAQAVSAKLKEKNT